jgi:hypothetical protein
VGVVFGDNNTITDFGAMWYVLERVFKVPFTPVRSSALLNNLDKFTCIIYPPGQNTLSPKVKEWVQAGGCLVAYDRVGWAIGESGFLKLDTAKLGDKEPPSVPGTQFLAELDSKSWISLGYDEPGKEKIPMAVQISGSSYYKAAKKGQGELLIPEDPKNIRTLSGWVWPEETAKSIAGTQWLVVQQLGRGNAVLFMDNPVERALWPGEYKLVLNAMLFGAR